MTDIQTKLQNSTNLSNPASVKCVDSIIRDFTDEYQIDDEVVSALKNLIQWHVNDLTEKLPKASVKSRVTAKKPVAETENTAEESEKPAEASAEATSSETKEASAPAEKRGRKKKTAKSEEDGEEKPKKKKLSAYTLFVQEQMALESVKNIPHKERMGYISEQWKNLDEDRKTELSNKASEANNAE